MGVRGLAAICFGAVTLAACASLSGLSGGSDADGGKDAAEVRDATPDHARAHEAGTRDATTGKDGSADTGHDAPRDTFDALGDAPHDAADGDSQEASCVPPPADAMPEGGDLPNPGLTSCNSLPPDAGGVCDTAASDFCCKGAKSADGGPAPPSVCQSGTGSSGLANLAACLSNDAPVECDETTDCPDASICCFAPNPDPSASLRGQYVKLCAPAGADGGCALSAVYPTQYIGSPEIRLCKKDDECGPCGTCNVYCCEGSATIEACESPSTLVCTVGVCPG